MSRAVPQGALPRIAVAEISHESNSFSSTRTILADFGWPTSIAPADALRHAAHEYTTLSGYVEGAREFGLELYPTVIASATPKGPVADEAFEALAGELVRRLEAAPRFDGVMLSLHGAMVVESYPSGDAEIVRRIREVVGPDLPVVVSHDFHANVTPEIVAQSTALVSYQEHPHIDTKARGVRAARIVAETVRGAAKPVQALVKPPMLYNIVLPASTHELRRLPGASAHPRGQGRRSAPRGIRADGGPHHRGRHGWSDGGEPCQAHLHARSPASVWSRRVRAGKRARRNSAAAHSEVAGTPPASVAAQRAESPASGVLEEFKGGHRPGGLGNI